MNSKDLEETFNLILIILANSACPNSQREFPEISKGLLTNKKVLVSKFPVAYITFHTEYSTKNRTQYLFPV